MNLLAQSALYLWLPTVVIIFAILPPKRAVIASYVVAWLLLPNIGFNIPGLPDYTKMTATVVGILLCMILFDTSRLFTFRFHWYDLPMLVWCVSPFISSNTNDLGSYDGLSASVNELVSWGLPYLIGRLYLTDLDSMRDLSLGILIGGLAYIPLCLIEIRFSPQLETWVYGITHWEGERYGGYRPKVFLSSGLELGMWMTNATLIGYLLWSCGAIKTLRGISIGRLLIALAITTVLCKSTGSTLLMLMGLGALQMARLTKRSWPIWLLLAIPPFYCVTRTFNIWSGQEVVELSKATVGEDRAQSFDYRLNMENRLTERALERPVFGWGGFNRSKDIRNKDGTKVTIVQDGFWIIVLGGGGMVWLSALLGIMLLPMLLTIRRFPVATWSNPQVGPVVALSMVLLLIMIDFLNNAMLNPIYAVVIGGLLGQSAVRLSGGLKESEASLKFASELMSEGRLDEAAQEFHRTILLVDNGDDVQGRQVHAAALDGLGHSLATLGRIDEAEHAFKDGLLVRDWLAAHAPDAGRFRDLAIAREGLARLLAETGRALEAVEERQIALRIWDILVGNHSRNADYRNHRIAALNDLAWLLATDPDPRVHDPSQALMLAEEAVRSSGDHEASWNTLGVTRYRVGDWAGAIEALERSALASIDGLGTAFDHYFLSMAWCRLQHEGQAREWLERGIAWTARHRLGHPPLERFREEAESLLMSESGRSSLDVS
jgi:tetratricopeptide (TPR) repeat protein